MRVCLIGGHLEPTQWSMRLYGEEIRELLENLRMPLEVQTVFPPRRGALEWIPSAGLRNRLSRHWTRWAVLPRQVASTPADVYHCLEPGDITALRRVDPSKIIVSCHDLIPWRLRSMLKRTYPARWISGCLYRQMHRGLHRARRIVVPSETTRRDLIEYSGILEERIRVIPYWLNPAFTPADPDRAQEEKKSFRKRFGLPEGSLLLHVGSTVFYKNLETLLDTLARLRESAPEIPFRFLRVGNPWTSAQANRLKALNLQTLTVRVGEAQSAQTLARLYRIADALIFPSWYEGFGRPPLEAMACGTPVVAGRAGALPEVVGHAGLLVDPSDPGALSDAIRRVLTDTRLRAELTAKGLERARHYRNSRPGEALYTLYEEMCGPSGGNQA